MQVRTLLMDEEGTLWGGTSGSGIFRFRDGTLDQFSRSHGLPVNDASTIVDDRLGNLWFGSYRGIHRIRKRNFDLVASGQSNDLFPNSFSLADGLSSMQCPTGHPAGFRTRDGNLWFATVDGVNVVDPKSALILQVVNNPIIEHLYLDGKEAAVTSDSQPIVVGPGVSRIDIRYTSISLESRAEIRFRYRLVGQDQDWIDVGRQRSASFSQLKAGAYTFEVMAADSEGDWSGDITRVALVVRGVFWKSAYFQVSAFLGVLTFAGFLINLRFRRQKQRIEIRNRFTKDVIENQEADRRRIARELHDSLEQNLLVIKNQAMLSAQDQRMHPDLKSRLDDISEISSSSIEEVQLIANNLRPYQIDRLGLAKAIESMLNKVSEVSGLEIERLVDDLPSTISPDLQMNIYRIIQEVLNNTVKHANATKMVLTLILAKNSLSLQIKDNGKGFQTEGVREGGSINGHGLRGIEERVDLFGGTCVLQSSIGGGTEWKIRIPLH
jgi:signal transduction histidine kinase